MNPIRLAPVLLLAFAAPTAWAAVEGDGQQDASGAVTIYRCVDAKGRLVALRDSPCLEGERQETLRMQRPQDPPPRATTTAPASTPAAADAPPREIRIVHVPPPQPMYECTAPDGTIYTSDSSEGNPRWVPAWTVGHPMAHWPRPPHARPPAVRPPPGPPPGGTPGGVAPPPPGPRPPSVHPRPPVAVVAGGTWVHDPCVRLLQEQVCRRLSDRRFEILRIYHAAMPSGRAELDREQARIDARMANDCPGF